MSRPIHLAARFLVIIAVASALLYAATPMPSSDNPYASSLNIVPEAQAAAPCKQCNNFSGTYKCVNVQAGYSNCKATSSGLGCRLSGSCG
jgi:hypothetical protein